MTLFKTSEEAQAEAHRRIMVMGGSGTGKSTFSLSASSYAPDIIGKERVVCKDVVLLQGDIDGQMGAIDAGLTPGLVVDMNACKDWDAYEKLMGQAIMELRGMVAKGDIKYCVVDLELPAQLLIQKVSPNDQRGWGTVKAKSLEFFKAFGYIPGLTLIGNSQIKGAESPTETAATGAAADAKAAGGVRSTFTADLVTSFKAPWINNSSSVFAREIKKVKDPMKKDAPPRIEFFTHCYGSSRFEVKSRFMTKIAPTEPGERSLHSILKACYGDAL